MSKTFTRFSREKIKSIHALSKDFNKLNNKVHEQVLLDLMREHSEEIPQLYKSRDKHYLIETGDLIILCLELLTEAKADPELIMAKCYERYNKKISGLIKQLKRQKRNKHG